MILDTCPLEAFHFMHYADYTQNYRICKGFESKRCLLFTLVDIEMPVVPYNCNHCNTPPPHVSMITADILSRTSPKAATTRLRWLSAMLTAIVISNVSENVFFTVSHTKMTLLCNADNYHYSIVYSFAYFLRHNYWQRASKYSQTTLCGKIKQNKNPLNRIGKGFLGFRVHYRYRLFFIYFARHCLAFCIKF